MGKIYYSTKDIADQLGTTKQRVYRCIKKHCIKEAHSEVVNGNTVLMYDSNAFTMISDILVNGKSTSKEAHEAHSEAPNDTLNEALYEALLKQLEVKDQQIEQLQKALDQAQKLNAMDKQKILELEDKMATAEQKEEPIEDTTKEDITSRKGFFARLFGI